MGAAKRIAFSGGATAKRAGTQLSSRGFRTAYSTVGVILRGRANVTVNVGDLSYDDLARPGAALATAQTAYAPPVVGFGMATESSGSVKESSGAMRTCRRNYGRLQSPASGA